MRLMTEEQVAERLTVTIGTLREWRSKRSKIKGPPVTLIGGAVRYLESDVTEWVMNQRKEWEQ